MENFDKQLFINKIKSAALTKFKKGGWINEVSKQMKKKHTVGSFTEWCGGKVTESCIERGLRSKDEKIRRRAQLAKNFRELKKKEMGGSNETNLNISSYIEDLKNNYLSKINRNVTANILMDIADKAMDLEDAYGDYYEANKRINELTKALYGDIVMYEDGGDVVDEEPVAEESMSEEQMQEQQMQEQQMMNQNSNNQPEISYEEYVKFVMSYPEYLQRLVTDLQQMQQQGDMQEAQAMEQ